MGIFGKLFGGDDASDQQKHTEKKMPWVALTTIEQLDEIAVSSNKKTQLIFKHSTRCGISRMVIKEFTASYNLSEEEATVFYLDLLNYREVSNAISEKFQVLHQSPQLLIIKAGKVIAHDSHSAINEIILKDSI